MRRRLSILALLTVCLLTGVSVPAKSKNIWYCWKEYYDESCVQYCCSLVLLGRTLLNTTRRS